MPPGTCSIRYAVTRLLVRQAAKSVVAGSLSGVICQVLPFVPE